MENTKKASESRIRRPTCLLGAFCIALTLFSARPSLADMLPNALRDADQGSVCSRTLCDQKAFQDSTATRPFAPIIFKVDDPQTGSISASSLSGSVGAGMQLGLGGSASAGFVLSSHQGRPIGPNLNDENLFTTNTLNQEAKDNERGGEGRAVVLSAVVTPEPGSGPFLLLALAAAGMMLYRRNALTRIAR